jgi:hypothetical protein
MSCSLTVEQVLDRTKTVTRRHVDTWRTLAAGDRLVLIEKGMGLKKGEKQRVLAEVEVVDVRVEPLAMVDDAEVKREGLWAQAWPKWIPKGHDPAKWFCSFWLRSHGYASDADPATVKVRRIEWRYLT